MMSALITYILNNKAQCVDQLQEIVSRDTVCYSTKAKVQL